MAFQLSSDGSTFAYSNVENPKVCYMHGWGRDSQDFINIIELFPGIALDLPGFGKSKSLENSMSPFEYAAYLNDIIPPAVHLSFLRPINNLVLIGVPLLRNTPKKSFVNKLTIFKNLNKFGIVSSAKVESIKNKTGSFDYRNSEGVMRETLVKAVNDDMEDKLSNIKSNVKLVWGENDMDVPVTIAEKSQKLISNSELTIIPNQGHNMLRSNPNSIFEVLKSL